MLLHEIPMSLHLVGVGKGIEQICIYTLSIKTYHIEQLCFIKYKSKIELFFRNTTLFISIFQSAENVFGDIFITIAITIIFAIIIVIVVVVSMCMVAHLGKSTLSN